ncbi:calpain-1 catalytic subunit-like isoform X2 [Oreochromis aureus]|uniref:Calpain catalytic domain-containing protein n=3 Tax=Oreochromis aureus TaxID=47969 RepID=A0A668RV93_OREAU|nr:calpain-1 catalytic subunit-like isoform X2 [Oreochromis aureus]XP_039459259.1 calpain-1 catalytic subunit-like isoform X2 [Oreochromis aureus]XP_039459260.1 calpain-1 catalytic subunit-like isoform X2 [Oreochromis aureus]XP_039459261.1 calpain-1 catalytic subunit-like isoform X2 [Oreochromis aureus]XP_039459262.1 calpain-1 catalytic subunit-like isoform X2 [Oreochromis aureus]XP_039459263.1 calpain-1 catalytic subunit-like isoform X2 [Oreochromis aureus]
MPPPGVCMNIISARHMKNGYGTVTNPERFLNQDFHQLKQYCLIRHLRYIDEMFPPDRNSIGNEILMPSDLARVVWLRPGKIVPNPSFVVDGVSRFDFGQGWAKNCWFIASIGALTFQNHILGQVVPLEQNFDEDYCGLFHFRFWRFGRWVDVIIDDKLPTIDGRLIFVHSRDPTEFWPALLEKAYAKVCGSYTDMNAGTPAEALVDFTGGVHIYIDLSKPPPDLWEMMCRAGQSKSLMGCGTPQGETTENIVLPNGLVQSHAYAVTGVKQMISRGQMVNLVRLWNPWGHGEWNGDWSDRSPLWQTVSPQDRDMCLAVYDDGEFWMSLKDFCKTYSELDICCMCPDFLDGNSTCHWNTSIYQGRWVAGTTAGGCMKNPESFWTNPQYRVKIDELSSECAGKQGEINMLISLMQKPDKRNRRLVQNLYIGFSVFEVPKNYMTHSGKFPASFFSVSKLVAHTKSYINAREVMELMMLKPGEYLIVPSTFSPNETASFILTILSKAETHVHENSSGHEHMELEENTPVGKSEDDESKRTFFRQHSDKYEEVDAEQLQRLLNGKILQGDLKSGGFTIDACRSMVALMDTSVTGKLNGEEFVRLWKKVVTYQEIFSRCDVSKTGTLSLSELRNAMIASGMKISDEMLNLMALRYGTSSGHITLESFISLVLRFECMYQIFNQLSDGKAVTLQEPEWMYIAMYT